MKLLFKANCVIEAADIDEAFAMLKERVDALLNDDHEGTQPGFFTGEMTICKIQKE